MTGLEGTGALLRLALRRDRVRLPVWVAALAGLTAVSASAVAGLYPDQRRIDAYAALVAGSPTTVAFAGPAVGLDTQAGIVVYETAFTVVVGVALLAVTTATRHSRAEEESGRSELLRATEVGRHAPAAAALLATAAGSTALAVALWLALAPTALTVGDAAVYAAGVAALGVLFGAATLCLAQVFLHARTATGAGLLLFGVAYVVRAAGDVRGDGLVWLSPVGWVQATHVPVENRWWPLLLPVAASALLALLAVVLAERRDFGGGLVPARAGPPRAPRGLAGPVGLTWRVQRGAVLAWALALLAFGLVTGSLGTSMQDMVEGNPALAEVLEAAQGAPVLDSYIATMVLVLALLVGGFAVWSAGHPGAAEDGGQIELVLAGPVSRVRSMAGHLLVTAAGTTVVLAAAAAGVGLSHAAVTGDAGEGWRAAAAQLTYLPAVLVLAGAVAVASGWLPRWTWVGWLLLGFSFVVGWLGGLLDPPQWVLDLSAFAHVPRVPVEPAGDPALLGLAALALALVAVGCAGFRRRDVGVG